MLDTHLGSGFRLFEVKICHSPLDIDYVELILAKQKGSSFTNLATHGLHILAATLTDRIQLFAKRAWLP